MSHFAVMVILPEGTDPGDAEEAAAKLLWPYREDEEFFADGSRWDWYVVGGRWDGTIRGLPWQDLKEPCDLCKGTGHRDDKPNQRWVPAAPWPSTEGTLVETELNCNGCNGTGQMDVWPTDERYSNLDRNLTKVVDVPHDYIPQAFVTPNGEWHEASRMGWWGMTIKDEEGRSDKTTPFDQELAAAREAYADHLALGVDCHI